MFNVFEAWLQGKITLTGEELELLRKASIPKKVYRRQYLLQEGDVWKYDAFVTKGCVRTYLRSEEGQEHILGFSIENWWTGDRDSLLSGKPSRLNIDAIEDSEILLWPHETFEGLCQQIPVLGELINAIIQKSFVTSQNRIERALSLSAEQKYTDFIERYPQLVLRVPQSMIASYLGVTPETISRVRRNSGKK